MFAKSLNLKFYQISNILNINKINNEPGTNKKKTVLFCSLVYVLFLFLLFDFGMVCWRLHGQIRTLLNRKFHTS